MDGCGDGRGMSRGVELSAVLEFPLLEMASVEGMSIFCFVTMFSCLAG
jgi:hypothetical protein